MPGRMMKRLFAAAFAFLFSIAAWSACTPNTGAWSIGSTTATLSVCAADGTTQVSIGSASSIPSGMIAAFNAACPSGWTEVTATSGRVIVGVPAAGTLAGTVGTALTNLQDKTHSHTYTDVVNHTHVQNYFPTATGGSIGYTVDTSMSGTQTATTLVTANPAGGVATGTTNTAATSNVIAYIQYRYCSKD